MSGSNSKWPPNNGRELQSDNEKADLMTETSLDDLGPVDYAIVEFPAGASNFTGEMAKELLALVDSGTIRVIDIVILTKNEDGTVEATELSDIGELGELQALEAQLAELLAEEDVEHLAAAMDPGSTAGVLIWENLWAARFAVSGAAFRWPTDRQRTNSDPGDHRLDRGRRTTTTEGD